MQSRIVQCSSIFKVVILRLLLVLVLFWLSRWTFYLFNTQYFSKLGLAEVFKLAFWGMRFDLSAVFMINIPYLFLMLIPFHFRNSSYYHKTVTILFYFIPNIVGLAANFIDTVYYRFTLKRMTADVFQYISQEEDQFLQLLPQFIGKFLPEFLSWIVFSSLLVFLSQRIKRIPANRKQSSFRYYATNSLVFIFITFLSVFAIRGGFQLKPIGLSTAAKHVSPGNIPLLLNTPFTLIKTIDKKALEEKDYYEEEKLEEIFSPLHHYDFEPQEFRRKNVVIIIMESFSTEHISAFNSEIPDYKGYTPFLDSLIKQSISFKGFANGKRSIEAIPAILAGLPSLMQTDYLTSPYAGNKINSLASLLKTKAYQTAFFHGGNNGTMNFDAFARLAGFEKYYGRREFNDDKHFDGKWGIFDEAFFQFFAQELNAMEEPFFASFFSLTSHHPYTIPKKYEGTFRKGPLEIQESIMYADYSLNQFFETASQMPWYKNTLFVITADHTSESYLPEYSNRAGNYMIPIIFFTPGQNTAGLSDKVAQQCDIMPTVLAKLQFNRRFVAFGNNLMDSTSRCFAIQYTGNQYQLIEKDHLLIYDGKHPQALYNYKKDILLKNNRINEEKATCNSMEEFLKAMIQQYNNRLINNQLTAE